MKIRITHCEAFGPVFNNLLDGSVHEVIEKPKIENGVYEGVWVMGAGEPVKVLNDEYVIIEP